MRVDTLTLDFVEELPESLILGRLYISIEHRIAAHLCCCGCGQEVITPISPTDWKLTFDGISVSLHPSIGNWSFRCRSHYFVRNNKIVWSNTWTNEEISLGRQKDRKLKNYVYQEKRAIKPESHHSVKDQNLLARIWCWLQRA